MIVFDFNSVKSEARLAVYVATKAKHRIYNASVNRRPAPVSALNPAPYPNKVPIEYQMLMASDESMDSFLSKGFSCRSNIQNKKAP